LLARVTELQSNLLRMVPSTTRILGRPLSEVRRVLRLDAGEGFDLEAARQRIAGDNYAVRRFLADLVTDGWLIQERADHWKVTAKAKELQSESRGRLTRVKADGLVGELLARVRTINQDSKYAFKIDSVVLFGSYLSNRDRIGDVDVAIALRPRLQKKEAQEALEEAARARGPRSRNIVDDLFRPRREVQQAVKAKSSWLDVREISELEDVLHRSSVAYKVVYGYWQPRLKGKENN
jgi:predicted nucleotidyltransferase